MAGSKKVQRITTHGGLENGVLLLVEKGKMI
jgi:hypothetical protein